MSRGGVFFAIFAIWSSPLVAGDAGATRNSVSPVQKVLGMIEDFSMKLTRDLDAAEKDFQEAAKFCDDEATSQTYAIKTTQGDVESLMSTIEDANAKIEEHESNIQEISSRISGDEGDLHKATKEREEQHTNFLANEKSLLANVDELSGAVKALQEQGMSLAQQTPDALRKRDAMVAGLTQVVEASFVSSGERESVKAFLQSRADAEDEITLNTQSKGAVETISSLVERAEATLSNVRRKEMNAAHEFNMLKQTMELSIKGSQQELASNTQGKKVTAQALAEAEKSLAVTKRGLAQDTESLATFKRECQDKARAWEAESGEGKAELKALAAAKDILVKKFSGAFVQFGYKAFAKRSAVAVQSRDIDNKARALRVLEELGHKLHSTALVALSYQAAADPFVKIRGMVEQMIAKLQKEAAEEATQKAFCDTEMGQSTKSKAEKEEKLETVNARIEKAESSVAVLTEQVGTLASEIADIDSAVTEATAIRQKEKAAFKTAETDFSQSQEACAQAIEVLREYYEGVALAQVGSVTNQRNQGKSTLENTGIIAMLEVAESDFARLLSDARSEETAAAADYDKMMADNKLSRATKDAERKGKESEVKTIKSSLADISSDKESLTSELDAVLAYISELKPQCETKVPSYAERKAKRDAEIDGLKEALDILEQDVALVQRTPAFLRRSS